MAKLLLFECVAPTRAFSMMLRSIHEVSHAAGWFAPPDGDSKGDGAKSDFQIRVSSYVKDRLPV